MDKGTVPAFMTMELGTASEIVSSQFPVDGGLIINLDIAVFL